MNQEERNVIDGIFERLRAAANQPRDPEAEKHIAQHIQAQPYAPYAMAQSVFVQEQALLNQQQQIEQLQAQMQQLETQLAQAQQAAQQPAPQQGGFLSGIFGGGAAAAQPQREPPAYGQRNREPQGNSPWGAPQQAPAPQAQGGPWQQAAPAPQGGGSSFLKTAAGAAAGVAGGMMIGNLLSSAFGGGAAHAATNNAGNFGNLGLDPKGAQAGTPAQNQLAQDSDNDANTSDEEDYDDADYGDDDFDSGSDSYEA